MKGCYERYASTTALVKAAKDIDPAYDNGRIIFEAFNKGNTTIAALLSDWTDEIAIVLCIFSTYV